MEFEDFKKEILIRAKRSGACHDEYVRAHKSGSFEALMSVIKGNFEYAVINKVIDAELIEIWRNEFNANHIYCNEDARDSYLLACDTSNVTARGESYVIARDEASVKVREYSRVIACHNSTVWARDHTLVFARNNAKVKAWEHARVTAFDKATIEAFEYATVEAYRESKIELRDHASAEVFDDSDAIAWGNSHVSSYDYINCKLNDCAIHRIRKENIIRHASDNIRLEKAN